MNCEECPNRFKCKTQGSGVRNDASIKVEHRQRTWTEHPRDWSYCQASIWENIWRFAGNIKVIQCRICGKLISVSKDGDSSVYEVLAEHIFEYHLEEIREELNL